MTLGLEFVEDLTATPHQTLNAESCIHVCEAKARWDLWLDMLIPSSCLLIIPKVAWHRL